jgi:hypothetical protein
MDALPEKFEMFWIGHHTYSAATFRITSLLALAKPAHESTQAGSNETGRFVRI